MKMASSSPRPAARRPDKSIYVPRHLRSGGSPVNNDQKSKGDNAKQKHNSRDIKSKGEKKLPVNENLNRKTTSTLNYNGKTDTLKKKNGYATLSINDASKTEYSAVKKGESTIDENIVAENVPHCVALSKRKQFATERYSEQITKTIFCDAYKSLPHGCVSSNLVHHRNQRLQMSPEQQNKLLPGMATNFVNTAIENAMEMLKAVKLYERKASINNPPFERWSLFPSSSSNCKESKPEIKKLRSVSPHNSESILQLTNVDIDCETQSSFNENTIYQQKNKVEITDKGAVRNETQENANIVELQENLDENIDVETGCESHCTSSVSLHCALEQEVSKTSLVANQDKFNEERVKSTLDKNDVESELKLESQNNAKCTEDIKLASSNNDVCTDDTKIKSTKTTLDKNDVESELKLESQNNAKCTEDIKLVSSNNDVCTDDTKIKSTKRKAVKLKKNNKGKRNLYLSNEDKIEKKMVDSSKRILKVYHNDVEKNGSQNLTDELKFKNHVDEKTNEEKLDDWDSNWTDDGDCLNDAMMKELSKLTGIQNPIIENAEVIDYLDFRPKNIELDDGEFGHILELFDFSVYLKTQDLFNALSTLGIKDYNITWVDDTHALAVFASRSAAHAAMKQYTPVLQMKQVINGTRQSKLKAREFKDALLPYKRRPAASALVARNLITGALGIKSQLTPEERRKEREVLKEARDEKRKKAKQKKDIWNDPE